MESLPDLCLHMILEKSDMKALMNMSCVNKRFSEFVKKERDTLTLDIYRFNFGSFIELLETSKIVLCRAELNFVIFFDLLSNLKLLASTKKRYKYQKYLKCTHDGSLFIFKNYEFISESSTFLIFIKLIEYIKAEYPDHYGYLKPWIIYLCLDYIALNIVDNERKQVTCFLTSKLREDITNRVLSIKYEIRRRRIDKGTKERLEQVIRYLEIKLKDV
jgi:hypothetical protein